MPFAIHRPKVDRIKARSAKKIDCKSGDDDFGHFFGKELVRVRHVQTRNDEIFGHDNGKCDLRFVECKALFPNSETNFLRLFLLKYNRRHLKLYTAQKRD